MDSDDMVFVDNIPSQTVVTPAEILQLQSSKNSDNILTWATLAKRPKRSADKKELDLRQKSTTTKDIEGGIMNHSDTITRHADNFGGLPGTKVNNFSHVPVVRQEQKPEDMPLPRHPEPGLRFGCHSNGLVPEQRLPSQNPPPPNPLPPPPPPPPDAVAFNSIPFSELPPPPPPFRRYPAIGETPYRPEIEVSTPTSFLPIQYSSDSVPAVARNLVHITPFRRNVFVTHHQAHLADFEEHKWLLQYGSTELWYEKPSRKSIKNLECSRWGRDDLIPLANARPVSIETPRAWASSVLVTPTYDDILECVADHPTRDDGTCYRCTEEKSEALEKTPLVYYLVLSTCQAGDPFIKSAHFHGRQIYKLIKCGSRDAAVAEAFYAAGANGWNIAFSCVMRLGEDFDERPPLVVVKRATHLWKLADEVQDDASLKVFY